MSGFPETQASGFDAYSTELESLLASPTYSPSTHAADAQALLDQMKLESRSLSGPTRASAQRKHKEMKAAFDRSCLLSGASVPGGTGDRNKDRLVATNERIEVQNDRIASIQQTVAGIEDTGAEITGQLASNREVIERQKERVAEVNTMADYAKKISTRMSKWWA
mmetsp:Transcript_20433/g.40870  ORF Transcript_20433/g.40870 Transcript_20433/m.40870 type:complete len:165 (+) Transcript_20433:199-693(+)